MAKILVTFPGRAGDLLWALPTVRALSVAMGQPVDLQIAGEFASMVPLLERQPYLGQVEADPNWHVTAWQAPAREGYMATYHLGYRRWPEAGLPYETAETIHREYGLALPELHLEQPWITLAPVRRSPYRLLQGWSDCYFELKVGLTTLLTENWTGRPFLGYVLAAPGSRWTTEQDYSPVTWLEAAGRLVAGRAFFGDCSALHVLAVAVGRPAIIVEPMEARWNPIFWPLGYDGPQVTCVKGNDGKPTWDARHTAETLQRVLEGDGDVEGEAHDVESRQDADL